MKLSVKRLNGLTLCTFAQAQLQCIFLFKPEKTNNLSSSKKNNKPFSFPYKKKKKKQKKRNSSKEGLT